MIYVNKENLKVEGDAITILTEYLSLTAGLTIILIEEFGISSSSAQSIIKSMAADAVDKYDSEEFYEPSGAKEARPSH